MKRCFQVSFLAASAVFLTIVIASAQEPEPGDLGPEPARPAVERAAPRQGDEGADPASILLHEAVQPAVADGTGQPDRPVEAPGAMASPQAVIGTAFSYQGRLTEGGDPANGDYDFRFGLYDAAAVGSQVGMTLTQVISVADGLFTAVLDFGPVFNGSALYLQMAVRPGGSADPYTSLSPRQALTPTPYAITLRPGALVEGAVTASPILNLANLASGNYAGIRSLSGSGTTSDIHPAGLLYRAGGEFAGPNGLIGAASAYSSSGYGVIGLAQGASGRGVFGWATADSGAAYGVYSQSDSSGGYGLYARASATSGITYGLFARSDSPDGYAGYFGNYGGAGGVALFARSGDDDTADIVLGANSSANDDGRIASDPAYSGSDIFLAANDAVIVQLDADASADDSDFEVWNRDRQTILDVDESGDLSLFATATGGVTETVEFLVNESGSDGAQLTLRDVTNRARFQVDAAVGAGGTTELSMFEPDGTETVEFSSYDSVEGGSELRMRDGFGHTTLLIEASEGGNDGAQIALYNDAGTATIVLDAEFGDGGSGRITSQVVEITGGSDLSERFRVRAAPNGLSPAPGMVVVIDTGRPGGLAVSTRAYDRKVAGVISGAGGIRPGMLMGQEGSEADGAHPVALTGRVYVWADASGAAIQPGDLLTTSDIPGHAMRVTEHARAQGAILGKAMTALAQGRGLVLVLVTLQ